MGAKTSWIRIGLPVAVAVALLIRLLCFRYESNDYLRFLHVWVEEFRAGGGLAALRTTTSDYNLPYLYFLALLSYLPVPDLYMIKLLSVVFDLVLAFTLYRIVARHAPDKPGAAFVVCTAALLWPTFLLNSAFWAQCDSIFTAFCLLSFSNILAKRPKTAVILAGLAFAFKLQAIFFLPVFIIFLIAKRVRLWHALLFPLPYIVFSLPALAYGWPVLRILSIYAGQAGQYPYLALNAPSVFAFFPLITPYQPYAVIGMVLALLFLLALFWHAFKQREKIDDVALAAYAAVITLGLPWLLPAMHDRYFYTAEVFALLYVAFRPKLWPLALLALTGSLGCYHAYLTARLSDRLWPFALAMLAALVTALISLMLYDPEPLKVTAKGRKSKTKRKK